MSVAPERTARPSEVCPPRPASAALSAQGFVRVESGTLLEQRGREQLGFLRATAELAVDHRLDWLALRGGVHVEDDAVSAFALRAQAPALEKTYGSFVLPWELYAAAHGARWTLSLGRQIVSLGVARAFPLLDVLNPRDTRVPFLGVAAERKLPLAMARASFAFARHRLAASALVQADYRFRPPPFALYSSLPAVLAQGSPEVRALTYALAERDVRYAQVGQGVGADALQALADYAYAGDRVELGLLAGMLRTQDGVLALPAPSSLADARLSLPVRHPRYAMLGGFAQAFLGSYVPYVELSADIQKPIAMGDLRGAAPVLAGVRESWLRGAAGLRYEGLDNGFVLLEATMGQRLGHAARHGLAPLLPVAPLSLSAAYRQSFVRERLVVEQLVGVLGPGLRGGAAVRSELTVRARDDLALSLAYVGFIPGERQSPLRGFARHDRVDLALRWDFAAAAN